MASSILTSLFVLSGCWAPPPPAEPTPPSNDELVQAIFDMSAFDAYASKELTLLRNRGPDARPYLMRIATVTAERSPTRTDSDSSLLFIAATSGIAKEECELLTRRYLDFHNATFAWMAAMTIYTHDETCMAALEADPRATPLALRMAEDPDPIVLEQMVADTLGQGQPEAEGDP